MKLVLGSSSPYRRQLLEKLQLSFDVDSPEIDESMLPEERPEQLVRRLTEEKARMVASRHPDSLVIASDQVALHDQKIIGKPKDHEHAISQLKQSSGKKIKLLTGIALLNSRTDSLQIKVVPYSVKLRPFSDRQIENYLQKDQPYNCAGSLRSENLGISLIEKFEGDDPNTLIGLPLIELVSMLHNEGIDPLGD